MRTMAALIALAVAPLVPVAAAQGEQKPSEAEIFHIRMECKTLAKEYDKKIKAKNPVMYANTVVSWHYNFYSHRCFLLHEAQVNGSLWYHLYDPLEERKVATAWGSSSRIEASIAPHEEVLKYITKMMSE